ncbi:MAG: hypothetical protein ACE5E7_19725, partial [Anaerolineae bacterium]
MHFAAPFVNQIPYDESGIQHHFGISEASPLASLLSMMPAGNTDPESLNALSGAFGRRELPQGEKPAMNLYDYVSNHPVDGVDPPGLWELRCRDLVL